MATEKEYQELRSKLKAIERVQGYINPDDTLIQMFNLKEEMNASDYKLFN